MFCVSLPRHAMTSWPFHVHSAGPAALCALLLRVSFDHAVPSKDAYQT